MVPKNCKSIPENWLELEISSLLKCRMKIDRFALYNNNDGEQVCICRFIEQYEKRSNFIRYFSRPIFCSFSSKVFGDMIAMIVIGPESSTTLSFIRRESTRHVSQSTRHVNQTLLLVLAVVLAGAATIFLS